MPWSEPDHGGLHWVLSIAVGWGNRTLGTSDQQPSPLWFPSSGPGKGRSSR